MNYTSLAANPLELAIDAIEMRASTASEPVSYDEFQQLARRMARSVQAVNLCEYIDRTLSLLVHAGLLERKHLGPGQLAYLTSPSWGRRDEVLCTLRAPKKQQRAWRVRAAAAKRAEKAKRKEQALAEARARAAAESQRRRDERLARRIAERGLTSGGRIRRAPPAARRTMVFAEQRA